ncbi:MULTISPECIES: ASKHA domain-containing protein [Pelosinus]|uniref:Ferredoxin n=1 Tax=Pelosinus fermentans B4 TaxID=1149862 RepID=I9LH10_9FIRM|nr:MULTISPECIES: ASKHA domain-containing protein [Pelosinus]EIW19789.1 ferredoxin [Pelosinus fermentans B4]EIW21354.1 ferredoxin [Pelosinus fermentans A11]OAM94943.1 ferredoxin [Pelosinus fermentans DSM 17108]SDR20816.1 Uncharacterized 2Fe-2 and 4Fe-4S clusters-containing protein, contains DUF4445 domain [Pelosinus fermentans]
MPVVYFKSNDKVVDVIAGTTVLAAARLAEVMIDSPCNGNGTCGKCKVKITGDFANKMVLRGNLGLSNIEKFQGIALACCAEVQDDVEVETIDRLDNESLQILSTGQHLMVELACSIQKVYDNQVGKTKVIANGVLLGVEEGDTVQTNYGAVVDIGTTTVVLALFDLHSGQELVTVSALNPQSRYAQDVLSRIKYASTSEGLDTMYFALINELNHLLIEAAAKAKINRHHVYEIVFSGNTCMLHLATRVNPASLGKYPYLPALYGHEQVHAADHGLQASPLAGIYLPPIISAYVGPDITSGILAAQLTELTGISLFIDIGTNGEMALSKDGSLSVTSTAAGPAFEGMNIACGMRAAAGAIEAFTITDEGLKMKTIGDGAAIGICGSGLIDVVGELVVHDIIGKNGKLKDGNLPEYLAEHLVKREGKTVFSLGENVYLSQKDIRQVQLAKGAIRAGIEALLTSQGVTGQEVDRIFIAGSFGYHLNPDSLIHIGLLPQSFHNKIQFLGNTSKSGGQAFLLNRFVRGRMAEAVKAIHVIELATVDNFDRLFAKCLEFSSV